MKILILGLSITSSWGNGHATTYRSLCRALYRRGHKITFVEKDVSWYRDNRDLPEPEYCDVVLYEDWSATREWLRRAVRSSDLVIVGSYFPDGQAAAEIVFSAARCPVFFYDIDTPVTVERLRRESAIEAISVDQIPHYDAYLSFTGGPMLKTLEREFGARRPTPLYCSVDPAEHQQRPLNPDYRCMLSYLGTYSPDRQPKLEALLNQPARGLEDERFIVAGSQYPEEVSWRANVIRIDHLPPQEHSSFYSSSRFTLNLTRDAMVTVGYSPSVRLFEAAACGAAILSDWWQGLDEFLRPCSEVVVVRNSQDVLDVLRGYSEAESRRIGMAARESVLTQHTSEHRAQELEELYDALRTPRLQTTSAVSV